MHSAHQPAQSLRQQFVRVSSEQEADEALIAALLELNQAQETSIQPEIQQQQAIVFVNSSAMADEISAQLNSSGISGQPWIYPSLVVAHTDSQLWRCTVEWQLRSVPAPSTTFARYAVDYLFVLMVPHADQRAVSCLVCTDVASRGLDFAQVSLCVQYEFATNAIDYLHRIGRVARAGHPGKGSTVRHLAVDCF
jgi:superfamily II DNA/RNA helicase